MPKAYTIWLSNAQNTKECGYSLNNTIYEPIDILLYGEIGAGKTTFLGGFAKSLGINEFIKSPTFALENRYQSKRGELLHMDFYRLKENQAQELYEQTEDFEGIRCIEWSDRLKNITRKSITIEIKDLSKNEGRSLNITFNDVKIPSFTKIDEWRKTLKLSAHIVAHCNEVAKYCVEIGKMMLEKGQIVRLDALYTAAQIHDLLRFIDFVPGASHKNEDKKEPEIWEEMRKKYEMLNHEDACAKFCEEQGYPVLGEIIKTHGVRTKFKDNLNIEQIILFYADKRMIVNKKVTLKERFDDFAKRYQGGKWSIQGKAWYEQAKEMEKELERFCKL